MQRYFIDESGFLEDHVEITGEDSKHIQRVMRMEPGDSIICCSASRGCFICEITSFEGEMASARIIAEEKKDTELPVSVTIAHGLPKGDKLELVIQKGTELGAFSFIPFSAERSVVKWDKKKGEKKLTRWNKIAKEAAEQSHRQKIPLVEDVKSLKELTDLFKNYTCVLAAYEEAAKSDEKSSFHSELKKLGPGDSLLFIAGPEGGFSDREIEIMKQHGAVPCGLGPRILRSETAPLYGLSAISYHFELSG
ncbi:16S rRNA (uracil(1498)-N(3))-methyltransferase [Evansella sp. LMS18]|uniref:16S rRNA (uracil(1498)-N(3))-methyltransferase n=1 Tax=Evansella sp. LMS18 TaxID=2924033 RepID=UPI0020D11A95|nr:16S rRNA (uracil(1498)-N(3))-methyltransferase [Evansella sp. LMS18]UTR09346.1 16S rRNA (uracil(1498)-N(3))-methyltransferase [Evansella sp. LMS18]